LSGVVKKLGFIVRKIQKQSGNAFANCAETVPRVWSVNLTDFCVRKFIK
jgi:hypothetical protein